MGSTAAMVARRISAPPHPSLERLYGSHTVLACLEVIERHRGQHPNRRLCAPTSSDDADNGASSLPRELRPPNGGNYKLYVRDFRLASDDSGVSEGSSDLTSSSVLQCLPPAQAYPNLHRIVSLAEALRVAIVPVERNVLTNLCGDRKNQNVVLEVPTYRQRRIRHLFAPLPDEVVLFLDRVVDPMNVGNILRSAFFFGVRRVVVSNDTSGCSPTVAKTSTGALEWMDVHRVEGSMSSSAFIRLSSERLKDQDVELCVIGTVAGSTFFKKGAAQPSSGIQPLMQCRQNATNGKRKCYVLLLGNEDQGLPLELQDQCTHLCHVPPQMDPNYSARGLSLNVNSACAVVLSALCASAPLIRAT